MPSSNKSIAGDLENSTQIENSVQIGEIAQAVLSELLRLAESHLVCQQSIAHLANRLKYTDRAIQRAINELQDTHYLVKKFCLDEYRRPCPNIYFLKFGGNPIVTNNDTE